MFRRSVGWLTRVFAGHPALEVRSKIRAWKETIRSSPFPTALCPEGMEGKVDTVRS